MKKFKIKSTVISALLFSTIIFYNCETSDTSLENIQLISPMGFKIADNISELKQTLELSENYKITSIKFEENNQFNVAFIDYADENGIESNYAIAKGKIKFNISQSIKRKLSNSNLSRVANKSWKLSCGGFDNCRVGGTLDNEGNMTFQCESSCCVLTAELIKNE